jgi:uncharacterized protein YecT (DUF1311 family)
MNEKPGPCQSPASNAEQQHCFLVSSKAADKELENRYKLVGEVLSPEERNDLERAQKLWLKSRDANCSAERNLYGKGTAAPTAYYACLYADTWQRTQELKILYGWRLE